MTSASKAAARTPGGVARLTGLVRRIISLLSGVPDSFIALIGRVSIAAIFWVSGQTKIQGLVIDIITGEVQLGLPRLSDSVVALFAQEYRLPLISPGLAAMMGAVAEHVFPLLILIGLATRFSAIALLLLTLTIQLLVYPDAYPTHGVWATVLLYLIARGPGVISLDHWIAKRFG